MNSLSLQLQLLFVLIRHTNPVPLADLSKKLKCSESTILRRIENLQQLLSKNHGLSVEIHKTQSCCLLGDREIVWGIIKKLREKKSFTTWRNKEERQLLILLKLLSSPKAKSKLLVLGTATSVAEATVLKDIKKLNVLFRPLSINSRPGAGTKITGKPINIQSKVMEYCYELLSPMNLIALACGSATFSPHKIYPCASELFLNIVKEKIDLTRIIKSINTWETQSQITLSDVAFVNLFIYLIIMQLRLYSGVDIKHYTYTHGPTSLDLSPLLPKDVSVKEIQLLTYFLLGLEENILFKHCSNVQQEIITLETVHKEIMECIQAHTNSTEKNIEQYLMKSLLLLKHRKNNLFLYWEEKLQPLYQGQLKNKPAFIHALDKICSKSNFLEFNSLLCVLDLFLEKEKSPVIDATLFCVTGINTATMTKKMIERHCPKLKINKTCSLRNCSHKDLSASIILSTAKSNVLPTHTIIIDPFVDKYKWNDLQDKIFRRLEKVAL